LYRGWDASSAKGRPANRDPVWALASDGSVDHIVFKLTKFIF